MADDRPALPAIRYSVLGAVEGQLPRITMR